MGDVLVTGATGKVGQHVVEQLVARGEGVRAASRSPRPPEGATGVTFDWMDDSTWAPALEGADRLFLVAQAEGAFDPTGPVLAFLDQALASGVSRVVLLSAMGMQHAPPEIPLRRVELAVEAADVASTVVRPNWFDQNFSAGPFVPVLTQEGRLPAPTGDSQVSFVDTRDIAAVAVEALVGDGHEGRAYTLTGPEALTFAEVAKVLAKEWDRPLHHDDVAPPEMVEVLSAGGLPPQYAEMLTGMMVAMHEGGAAPVTDDVERVTGTPARSLTDYARTTPAPWAGAA